MNVLIAFVLGAGAMLWLCYIGQNRRMGRQLTYRQWLTGLGILVAGALFALRARGGTIDNYNITVINIGNTNCDLGIELNNNSSCGAPQGSPQLACVPAMGVNQSSGIGGSSSYPNTIAVSYGNTNMCSFVSPSGHGDIWFTNFSSMSTTLTTGPNTALAGNPNQPSVLTIYVGCFNNSNRIATNCTFRTEVINTSSFPQSYGLYHNGQFTGTAIAANPNSTVPFTMQLPNCDPANWAIMSIVNSSLIGTGTVTQAFGPNGSASGVVITGVTNGVQNGPYDLNTNLQLGFGTNFNGSPSNYTGTNVVSGPTLGNNTNVNNILNQGLNGVINAVNTGDNLLSNVLSHGTGGGNSTNIVNVNVTNIPNTLDSNLLSQIASNTFNPNQQGFSSNQVANMTGTNLPYSFRLGSNWGSSMSAAWTNSLNGILTTSAVPSSVDGETLTIAGANGIGPFDIDLSLSGAFATAIPSAGTIFSTAKAIMVWVIFAGLLFLMVHEGEKLTDKAMSQRQVQGSTQEVLGENASSVIGYGYAILIAALLLSLPTLFIGYMTNNGIAGTSVLTGANSSALYTGMGYFASHIPFYNHVLLLCPVWEAFGALVTFFIYRYLVGWSAIVIVRGIIMFLIN